MQTYLSWILLFIAVQAVLSGVQFLLRKKTVKLGWRIAIIVCKAVLAVAFALLVMAGPVFLRPVQRLMVAVYAALLPDAAADLIYSLFCRVRRRKRRFAPAKLLSLALGLIFFVYGTVNMQIVTPEHHTYASEKLTQGTILWRLVVCTAMHVGCAALACSGLARAWSRARERLAEFEMSVAMPRLIAAVVIHGIYNLCALIFAILSR